MCTLVEFLVQNVLQFRKARLPSLYSDFRQQQYSNPDGYSANLVAWEAALSLAAEKQVLPGSTNSLLIYSGNDLLEALHSKEYGTPSALGTVLSEAVSKGTLVPQGLFLHAKQGLNENNPRGLPWRLASWAIQQLGIASWMPDKMPTGDFVILTNLKKANEKLSSMISESQGRIDAIWPIGRFRASAAEMLNLKDNSISDADLQVLLIYLSRDKNILAYNESTVKFRTSKSEILEITEQDQNIASLKNLIAELMTQTQQIATRIEELDQQLRTALGAKNRTAALRHLKSKKMQESMWSQRSDTLVQLEDVLTQIEQAATQVEVMNVLKSSTNVLKGLNAEIGDMDSLQDVLDSINEETVKTQEISNAIGDTMDAGLVIDETEIDDELAALEAKIKDAKVEDAVKQVQDQLDHLPALESSAEANSGAAPADVPISMKEAT